MVLVGAAVFLDAEGLGILRGEPGRGCGGGRSDDDGDMVTGSCVNGALKPVEIVMAFGWLEFGPGEFADADEADVSGFHEGEVGVPAGFGPLLWIPGSAEVVQAGCAAAVVADGACARRLGVSRRAAARGRAERRATKFMRRS